MERTMTLSTPRMAMRSRVSLRAPSEIETMASTLATPRMMPSVASAERNLWSDRSSRAIRSASNRFIIGGYRFTLFQFWLARADQLTVAHVEDALDAGTIGGVVGDEDQRLPFAHELV